MAGEKEDGPIDFSVEGEDEHLAGEGAAEEGAATEGAEGEADPDAAAVIAGEEADAAARGGIPPQRFQRVSEKLTEQKLENARLRGENDALRSASAPGKTAAAAVDPVDIDKLEDHIFEATIGGDKETALKLRREVNAELERRAETKAEARAVTALENARRADIQNEMQQTAEALAEAYPFLDVNSDERNDEAIALVVAARDNAIAKGVRPVLALQNAVKKIAPLYGGDPGAAAEAAKDDLGKQRQRAALERAGKTSIAQPTRLAGGIGERAAAGRKDTLSDEQIRALNTKKMFAGEDGS